MADVGNVDGPNGFTPVRHLTGGTIRAEEMPIASTEAAAIYSGDVVMAIAGGTIKVGTAVAGAAATGVFAGCFFTAVDGTPTFSKHWPAGQVATDAIAYVYADPMIVFSAQTAGAGVLADNGALLDLTATAGNATTGRSKQEINEAASTVDQFRQLDRVKKSDNLFGDNCEMEVVFHKHVRNPAAGAAI
tara:strand:+ start:1914 stop:2480 length:567 start_codon:yes stop_codon:yes gene_type:complete